MAQDLEALGLEPPDWFDLYVCRTCGAWDLAPEITHNGYCPGRGDASHIDHVVAEAARVEPYIRDGS
jgi:hypothetical protein